MTTTYKYHRPRRTRRNPCEWRKPRYLSYSAFDRYCAAHEARGERQTLCKQCRLYRWSSEREWCQRRKQQ